MMEGGDEDKYNQLDNTELAINNSNQGHFDTNEEVSNIRKSKTLNAITTRDTPNLGDPFDTQRALIKVDVKDDEEIGDVLEE